MAKAGNHSNQLKFANFSFSFSLMFLRCSFFPKHGCFIFSHRSNSLICRPISGENTYLINRENTNNCYFKDFKDLNSASGSFKRRNPETYFNLSIEQDEEVDRNKQSVHYFQIVEASLGLSVSLPHQQKNTSLMKKIKNSKAADVFRYVTF